MYYSIFTILLCAILVIIFVDSFLIRKKYDFSSYLCFLIFYPLSQKEENINWLTLVCLLIFLWIYYDNRKSH